MSYDSVYKLSLKFQKIAQQISTSDDARDILQSILQGSFDNIFNKLLSEGVTLNDWQIDVTVDPGRNTKIVSMPGGASSKQALQNNDPKPLEAMFGDRAPQVLQEMKTTKQKFDQLLAPLALQAKRKLSTVPSDQLPVDYSPLFKGLTLG
jgi:hypothetical protein